MKRSFQIVQPILSFLIIFCFWPDPVLFSQCTNGTQPECKCSTAPVLCTIDQLDGYTFSMTSYLHPNDGPSPVCPGANMSQTNNPTWFAFTAWCTNLTLRVTSTNCQQVQGFIGFQLAIYSDCIFSNLIACNADINDCNTNAKILNLSGLNIGSIYYFMVDGCLGSYCTVTIDVIGVCGQEQIDPWSEPVSGNMDPCIGNSETYTVEDLNGARIYYWYINGVLQGQTTTENFDITWTTPGTYDLCIDASNDPCIDVSDPPVPLCTTITVHEAHAGTLQVSPSILCAGDAAHISSNGFTSRPYNTQMLIITDANGIIIEVINASNGNFIALSSGAYTVYAYNFVTNVGIIPLVGGQISNLNCTSSCCNLVSQVITYQHIQAIVSDILCDDNGTGNDASDDIFTFNVLVTGLPAGMSWRSTDGTIDGIYDTPKLCGPYFISGGTLQFDLHDYYVPTCWTSIRVDPPMPCSVCIQTMDAGVGSLLNCFVTEATLTGTSSAPGMYHWSGPNSFSSDSLMCVVQDSGWYVLSIDFGNNCINTDSVFVDEDLETPVADAGADQQLDCNHTTVILDASGSTINNSTIQWINTAGHVISTQTLVVVDSVGTYLLYVTDTNTGCTSYDTTMVTIIENDLGIILISIVNENCIGDEDGVIEVIDIPGGSPPYTYSLNGMATTSTGFFDQLTPRNYLLHIQDANGCAMDTTLVILDGVDLQVEMPEFIQVTEDENELVQAVVNVPEVDLSSIQWTPSGIVLCDTCLSTFIHTHDPHTLSLTVIHINGCEASASLDILVVPAPEIYIPNTFSPNEDGINDRFTVYTNDGVVSILELNIFDRWGEQIFQVLDFPSNDPLAGWDGNFHAMKMPSGTYVYIVKILLADGMEKVISGDVTLVR